MKVYKTLFLLSLISGFTIILISIYLRYHNQYSSGVSTGRYGNVHYGMIDGFSGLILGTLILLFSVWTYKMYKNEKKKFNDME